jgi:hypothetical protein
LFIDGETNDLRWTIVRAGNALDPPDPRFDAQCVPQVTEYTGGYRRRDRAAAAAGCRLWLLFSSVDSRT